MDYTYALMQPRIVPARCISLSKCVAAFAHSFFPFFLSVMILINQPRGIFYLLSFPCYSINYKICLAKANHKVCWGSGWNTKLEFLNSLWGLGTFKIRAQYTVWRGRLHNAQSTHRVAVAPFWRSFHHDGKISSAWWGWGGARPLSFTLSTITSKLVVYAPAERAHR